MDDFASRFSQQGYEPHADDRAHLLKALIEQLGSPSDAPRLRRLYDSVIDAAGDGADEGILRHATQLADLVASRVEPENGCLVYYSCSNAWAELRKLEVQSWEDDTLDHPALLKQLYFLRASVQHSGFKELAPMLRSRIHCNLGNALRACGRWIEALREWRNALEDNPILGMALGNLGIGLAQYGSALYDPNHTYWLLVHAQRKLASAIEGGVGRDGATYPEAIEFFKRHHDRLVESVDDDGNAELFEHSLGSSKEERRYRRWCLEEQLFLNPMNDLGAFPAAAQDVLTLPGHDAKAGITYLGFYNQLKQEYGFARHCLYLGDHAKAGHVADRGMSLAFNCDYALYGMGLEQIKTAYRSAYSLLDKLAYFINAYWKLGIPEKAVGFRTVWLKSDRNGRLLQPRVVRDEFISTRNLPLRALYWVSQDIYSKELKDVARPDAQALDELRNHLEHKYAKIVDSCHWIGEHSGLWSDHLAFVLDRDDLYAKSLLMLKLSRAALIYLCLAMHFEESQHQTEGPVGELPVEDYPDDLKT
ncbi:LA2681 family HEPN domain-containing protein [Pseudomonas fontis]|uniref:LA2681 family HEPN domain-containing protein n=1 Tax=Pseudomonas fontis TaxID=2942633 RepID=A0ABT5NTS3_9PSED|nr:LA2681 family HEPN domain-containing protein [Pseudomonas fontis]MDD0977536.1 LA2681 family HEPN domain-containing protein [Pseudomonas fontis]MDD0991557.1 LA2681 family HEPN domain-containing protein [Pseudomonas fontis]